MSGVELVCINLDESATPGAKKFWKTCTFRTFCTRQSWERIGPALRDGALSGNHFCTQLAPYAPVCGVSGISLMPLNRRRPLVLCVSTSEDLPRGVVESACADGAGAVERAVFHGVGEEVAEHGSSVFGLGLSWPSEPMYDYSENRSSCQGVGAFDSHATWGIFPPCDAEPVEAS